MVSRFIQKQRLSILGKMPSGRIKKQGGDNNINFFGCGLSFLILLCPEGICVFLRFYMSICLKLLRNFTCLDLCIFVAIIFFLATSTKLASTIWPLRAWQSFWSSSGLNWENNYFVSWCCNSCSLNNKIVFTSGMLSSDNSPRNRQNE